MASLRGLLKPCYLFAPGTVLRRMGSLLSPAAPPRQIVRLPWGHPFEVNVDETIGGEIFRQNIFDIAVSEVAWRLIKRGDLVVDVGANIGYMTSLFAAKVGVQGQVVSFEPHPVIFARLQRNLSLAGSVASSVVLHNCALGAREGTARLLEPAAFGSNQGTATLVATHDERRNGMRTGVEVPVARLDTLLGKQRIALLKIDVEGFEEQVLAGSTQLLSEHRIDNVIYEAHDCERSPLHALLQHHGYSVHGIGYSLMGPRMSAGTRAPAIARSWESPSYLATLNPETALPLLRGSGWRVLRNRR